MSRPSPVPDWVPGDLPRSPGVYQFEDAHGTALYVGKSVNLRRRVRGYFYGGGPADPDKADMLRLARRVAVRRTGSDLEARLEEAERIVERRPRYNRALKNRSRGWYVAVDWTEPYPRLRVLRSRRGIRARHFGPFRGRRLPAEIVRLTERIFRLRTCPGALRPDPRASPCLQLGIGLCTAPCVKEVGLNEYRRQVRAAVRLLAEPGFGTTVRARLLAAREEARRAGERERLVDSERRLGWLEQLEELRPALESPALERSWLVVLPHWREGWRVLLPVARGLVLPRRPVRWDGGWPASVEDSCYALRVAELRAEASFPPAALVPSLIVTRWLREGAEGGIALDLDRLDAGDAVERLDRLLAA